MPVMAMDAMPMPGGWTMSMTWMRMPGQTWPGAAAAFLGTWIVMMSAMMLPSLLPMLSRYRQALGSTPEPRLGALTLLAGIGYFALWTLLGMAAFALGAALAAVAMAHAPLARAVPLASGALVLVAGALQFTPWKAHHLACCRAAPDRALPADARTALRHGWRLGLHCGCSSAGYIAVLFVFGVMDVGTMAVVTAAISAERLAPGAEHVARVIGAVVIAAGGLLVVQAAGLA